MSFLQEGLAKALSQWAGSIPGEAGRGLTSLQLAPGFSLMSVCQLPCGCFCFEAGQEKAESCRDAALMCSAVLYVQLGMYKSCFVGKGDVGQGAVALQ